MFQVLSQSGIVYITAERGKKQIIYIIGSKDFIMFAEIPFSMYFSLLPTPKCHLKQAKCDGWFNM